MTGEPPPEPGRNVQLRLDPDFARYYGLPRALPLRLPPGIDPGETPFIGLETLARSLETEARDPHFRNDPEIRRFLSLWPSIEKVERYLSMGNFTFAARAAADLSRQAPDLPCAAYALGVAASRDGDLEAAADHLEGCLSACPRHVPAAEELAAVLALSGAWDGALLLLDRLDAASPESGGSALYRSAVEGRSAERLIETRDLVTLMGAAGRNSEPETLLTAVEQATRALPDNAEVHRRAALSLRARGDLVRARTLADRAARLDPRSAAANHTLARLALETGDLMEAERSAIRARSLAPEWMAPTIVLASALRADARPAQAASLLKRAAEEHPDDMNLRKLEALCLLEAGRPAEARERLLEVARHDAFDPAAHFNLARASEALKDWPAARAAYEEAIARAPGFAAAREALALLDFRLGQTEKAREALERLVREAPDEPCGYRGLGDLHVDTDPARAAGYYEEALARRDNFPCAGLLYLAGLKALLSKDYGEAARLFERSVKADARRHKAWCNLGVARFHEGRLEEAISAMEEAADLDPSERGYQENLRVFYRTAFWRHPFRNYRFLSRSRAVARRIREKKAGS